jgi:glycine/serine hydroxymethyltransferase
VSAGTTRGFRTAEIEAIGHLIADVLDGLADGAGDMAALEDRVWGEVTALTRNFPIYPQG